MSEIHDQSFKLEQERVNSVVEVIDQKLADIEKKTGNIKENIISLRKTFWEDVTVNLDEPDDVIETHTSIRQQAELLSERERSHGLLSRQWRNLNRLKASPFFGRIDFKEDGEESSEKIYIGLFSLIDEENNEFLVYDWRAPISSMYYDYAPGEAQYETMDGNVHGEIELKRQYIIKNGLIKGMFDTGLTIGDEILREVLSSQADAQMKNIAATIQKEQNRIIRDVQKRYLVVQGAAGSGKTSAALQRVAYLLYRYREHLSASNILLFSPNPLFNSYVATVLPELGEENMQQTTYYQYLLHRLADVFQIEDPYTQLEYILSAERDNLFKARKESIRFKAGLEFKQLIDQYFHYLNSDGLIFKNISFRGEPFVGAQEIRDYFYSLNSSITIPNRLQIVKEWLIEKLEQKEKSERSKQWVEEERELLDRADYLKIYKKLQKQQRFTEDTFNDFEREEQMLNEWLVKRRIKPLKRRVHNLEFVDIPAVYRNLFSWSVELTDMDLPDSWKVIGNETSKMVKNKQLFFEDATPYLYLKDKLEGKQSYTAIKHLFIDEAQDYSPFQFAFLKEIFPNSKMTILGDINQSIFSHSVSTQNGLAKSEILFPEEQLEKIVLTKSYRSTRQITEFTEGLLNQDSGIEPFNRQGERPKIFRASSKDELHAGIIERVTQLQTKGYDTIAIICKTAKETNEAFHQLKDKIELQMIKKETISYDKGLSIIPSYLAKGIEFDAVLIYDGSLETYFDEDERRLFYTACTRAMHELDLFYLNEKSPFIKEVESTKYEEIKLAEIFRL